MDFSYEIVYKPGAANCVADTLSRMHEDEPQLLGLTVSRCDLVSKIQAEYSSNPILKDQYQAILRCPTQHPEYKIIQ